MGVQVIGEKKTRQVRERCGLPFDRVLRLDNHHWEGRVVLPDGHVHVLIRKDDWSMEVRQAGCWSSCRELPARSADRLQSYDPARGDAERRTHP